MTTSLSGLLLVGTFKGVEPVRNGEGAEVENFYRITVEMPAGDGGTYTKTATFNWFTRDNEKKLTDRKTRTAQSIDEAGLEVGDACAINVQASPQKGSDRYVNFKALFARKLDQSQGSSTPSLHVVSDVA